MAELRLRALPGVVLCMLCAVCNGKVGGGGHVAPPKHDGAVCNDDVECASDDCSSGHCRPPANGAVEIDGVCTGGQPCVGDTTCQDGICVETAAACVPNLQPCLVDGDCCSGDCAPPDFSGVGPGTCTGGAAMCAALLDPCVVGQDCCSTSCSTDSAPSSSRTGTCTAGSGMCVADGDTCLIDTDCCNGGGCYEYHCTPGGCDYRQSSGGKGQCSPTCGPIGSPCFGGDCCNGYCGDQGVEVVCQSCPASPGARKGKPCASNADCCGLTCTGSGSTRTCQ